MFKIQIFKTVLNLDIRILNLFRISDFEFRIYNSGFLYPTLVYEKEAAKISSQVYQFRESSDSPRSFRYQRTGEIN